MNFLKSKVNDIAIITCLTVFFMLMMLLYNVPLEGIILSVVIVLFLSLIYLFYARLVFNKEQSMVDENEQLRARIVTLRNDKINYQSEVESYFLMWVHQMKTPITASKLLLESPDEETARLMRHEILQIDNYTNLALSYLKLMNDKTEMVLMETTLDDMIKPIIKRYAIQFIHHKTTLHYQPIHSTVLTDAQWLSILIEQLLNNALKYAQGKEIWIDYNEHCLSIRDNGVGINRSDLPKIFDKGFSGYNGRLSDKSSGIGLYIVRTIAARLNVSVTVDSVVGEGTVFYIHF